MKAVASIINHSEIYHERAGKCQLPKPTNTINLSPDLLIKHVRINTCDPFLIALSNPICLVVIIIPRPSCTHFIHQRAFLCRNLFIPMKLFCKNSNKSQTLVLVSSIRRRGGGEPVGGRGGEGKREVKHGGVSCEKWLKIGPKIRGWKVGGAVWIL